MNADLLNLANARVEGDRIAREMGFTDEMQIDAFRHAVWQATLTQALGVALAHDVGDLNETVSTLATNKWCQTLFIRLPRIMSVILLLSLPTACVKTYQGARQLAIEMGAEIKDQVCPMPYKAASPCGEKDVRSEADFGNAVYLYIYGIKDPMEMQLVVNAATKIRDKKDRRIPIHITFYADLTKSHEIKTIKVEGG